MTPWFRFYRTDILEPRVQRLSLSDFKFWISALCMANEQDGSLPPVEVISLYVHLSSHETEEALQRLSSGTPNDPFDAPLIARVSGGSNGWRYAISDWKKRQYKSDSSTDRVKRFRAVSGNVSETHQNTENRIQNTDNKKTTKKRAAKPPSGGAESDSDFEEFWQLYPRREARKEAEKAYAKARRLVSKEELHGKTAAYAKSRVGQDPQFTPLAASWLNKERWRDVNVNSTQAGSTNIFGAQIPPHSCHTINGAEIQTSRVDPKDPSEWPTEEETREEFERFMELWPKKQRAYDNKDHEMWRSVRSRWEAEDIFWELELYKPKVHDWTQRELPWAYRWLEKFFLLLPNERLTIKTKQHRNANVIQHEGRMN